VFHDGNDYSIHRAYQARVAIEKERRMGTGRSAPGEVVLRLEGVFDVPAARRVERMLERAKAGDAVRLDLTHVREFHDFGIAILAQALKHGGAVRVALLGLRQHQFRLLRYFGVDAAQYAQPPSGGAS
jgi:hypothetical protein